MAKYILNENPERTAAIARIQLADGETGDIRFVDLYPNVSVLHDGSESGHSTYVGSEPRTLDSLSEKELAEFAFGSDERVAELEEIRDLEKQYRESKSPGSD